MDHNIELKQALKHVESNDFNSLPDSGCLQAQIDGIKTALFLRRYQRQLRALEKKKEGSTASRAVPAMVTACAALLAAGVLIRCFLDRLDLE